MSHVRDLPDDTCPVRATEQLNWKRLASCLRDHCPHAAVAGLDPSAEIRVAQFPGGHSNLTYLLQWGDVELVVRRPPFGPVAPSAHDMAREYRWLTALHDIFPPAPRAYLFVDDLDVLGAPFYVMERRRGIVVRREEPPALKNHPAARGRVSRLLIDTLVDLHAVDIQREGLAHLGKPAGFVERQVRGWTKRWHRARTTEVPEMDAAVEWLTAHLPSDPRRPSIVHGDFRLDNVMLDREGLDRVVAVFDWEMTALGDPLVDLGILLVYWGSAPASPSSDARTSIMQRPGWFTREDILERYAARSGRDVSGVRFYEILACFKVAVVVQQIFFRYVRGQTDDPRFRQFDARVASLARRAAALMEAQ